MPKAPPKDNYRLTIAAGDVTADFDYRTRELSFLGNEVSPCFADFVQTIGQWENFSVSRGMDINAWVTRPAPEVLRSARALHAEIDSRWDLYGQDYWYRSCSDWSKRRGLTGILLSDGRHGLLSNRIPGELTLNIGSGEEIVDLRPMDEYLAESPPRLRFYRKPNDIRWRELLLAIIAFVEAHPTADGTIRIRHHYVNDPVPKPAKARKATKTPDPS